MEESYQWDLISLKDNRSKIIEIYKATETINNFPAANHWQYLYSILDAFYDSSNVCFAILMKDKKPIFLMPISIYLSRKFIVMWIEIGFPFHNHINLIKLPNELLNSSKCLDQLISVIRNRYGNTWSRFTIRNVITDNEKYEFCDLVAYFNTSTDLSLSDTVSKKHLRNIKRLENKLESDFGEVSFNINQPTLNQALGEFIEVERCSWKGTKGIAIYSDNKLIETYYSMSDHFSDKNMLIANIKIDNQPIAAALGFTIGETLYIHKISFNQEYSKYAPGNILIKKLLDHFINQPDINNLNLVTSPEWAKRWHPNYLETRNIVFYNQNLRGHILKIIITQWRNYKPIIKKFIKNLSSIFSYNRKK